MTDPSLYDSTPLHYASSNGMATAVSRLLELGADPDAPNEQGETALFWACESGKSQVVKLLLDAGANATCQNEWGETAIDIAASHGSLKVMSPSSQPMPAVAHTPPEAHGVFSTARSRFSLRVGLFFLGLQIVSLLREHGAEEGDLGKDEEKEEPPREDGAPPQDWEGGADMETETVSALDESDGGVRRGDDDGGLRGRRARPGAKRGGGDDEEADSDQGLGGVDESGANAALEEGMVLGERVRRAPSASQRPFIREAMRREEALRKRDGEGGGKEDEEAVRALFGDDALASIRRERELMKEDDDARARAGKREEATWERLADDGSVYAQVGSTHPCPSPRMDAPMHLWLCAQPTDLLRRGLPCRCRLRLPRRWTGTSGASQSASPHSTWTRWIQTGRGGRRWHPT